jgi:PAS domain S-box-containing protein
MPDARDPSDDGAAHDPGAAASRSRPVSVDEAMQDAELRLRAIFDHTFQFMGVLTIEGVVLEVNRAALEFGGLEAEQVVGRPFWETDWWQDNAVEQDRLRAAIAAAAQGEFVRYEVELTGADGVPRTLDFSLKPVHDRGGDVVLLIAESRDITETKWVERALRVSEAKFAGMIAIASDAIISVDENQSITLFNTGAETIFGYSAAEVLGQSLDILLPERARVMHGRHLRNFAASPVAARRMGERQEIMGRRRDGTEFPAEASISKLDLSGSMIFTVVLRDITERKRVERSQRFLAEAGAMLASSLDFEKTLASVAGLIVPDLADWSVIYIRDDDGSLRRIEAAHADAAKEPLVRELMRHPLDPRTRHPAFAVLETGAPELVPEVSEEFLRAISQSDEHLRIHRELGTGSLLVVPLRARGETLGAIGFFAAQPRRYGADELALAQELALISALAVDNARLYRDAQAAVQARDDMVAVVSHDLGNPLSAIRIGTALLLRTLPAAADDETDTGPRRNLEFIRQSVQQMENLVNDLLDVKRLESGGLALRTDTLRPVDIVNDVMDVFRPIADDRGVTLESRCPAELPAVAGDYKRLVQVLANLVGNALKFTDAGGRVTIAAHASQQIVLFSVTDTGTGIDPQHLPRIFDRFWQARREGRAGLGLGLAIARGVVEAHGGRIWAESTPGAGSTFLFTIPIAGGGDPVHAAPVATGS